MAERIPQSTSKLVPIRAYLSSDHVSPATGKTIAVTISQNGGAFANPSAGTTNATEISNGWYYVTLSTTDTGTLGPLVVIGTCTGVDQVDFQFDVVKATNGGITALPDTAVATNGSLLTAGTGTSQINPSGGSVTAGTVSDKTGYSLAASQTFSTTGSVGAVTGLTATTIAAAILASPTHPLQTDSSGNALISASQVWPLTGNVLNSTADCMNAARAQGFGKWTLMGTALTLFGSDGTTTVRTFTLDSPTSPTTRT